MLTPTEIFETAIVQYASDIDYKVYIAFQKVRKPTYLDADDLKQSALLEIFRCFCNWYNPDKSSPRTFLNMCLHGVLHDLVQKSWRGPIEIPSSTTADDDDLDGFNSDFSNAEGSSGFESLVGLLINTDVFSEQEIQYIQHFWEPTQELTQSAVENPRGFRKAVRTKLGISPDTELHIRRSIESKLTA